ncbi:UDP-2,3-diacylglucosamine diphosphatase [Arcticibacterium luteifluviistationis]|uniref:UDP-2,3-diacylglucosamine diphosphatase n=1 Tax=Arcticibacterium luteifluviistationis TaxID=1784714 RepID=A0A2Z4GH43_9BACT|nr:UDP-2,3-diacylglucosamine diphosphatase [Arcticibacterium luteifluviistationis]AWW00621.1 UDP-2,3-diacylglucosamine diphosphatase [Arcticibacterium luteifluviistationis]
MKKDIPHIVLEPGKKLYFASDFHLGAPNHAESLLREKRIISWLDHIKTDAQEIFLVGDLFDFWFEYKHVVPKGYVRFFGKLAELVDAGIIIKIFTGNHDLWMADYFKTEIGTEVIHAPVTFSSQGKTFYVGHGDGLGPGDKAYKFLKKSLFNNPICTFLFGRIMHPNLGMFLGNSWSLNSWKKNRAEDVVFEEIVLEKEFLYQYIMNMEKSGSHHDFYIFGHRHIALDSQLNEQTKYVNLGDWIRFNSYGVFDGEQLELKRFQS